ncbi:MAG: hypothetical protein QOJ68_2899 [Blastococcus sp.]|jgi:hypothetical protein|nr:hypothetical protein [Blastococcus sp.]
MDSTDRNTTLSTSPAPTGRLSPRPPATSLAGLIDVLDRVDGPAAGPGRRRLPDHRSPAPGATGSRSAGFRPNGFRATATRSTPLRSVQPAPMARRPAATTVVEPGSYWDMSRPPAPAAPIDAAGKPARNGTRVAALIRRAAMWGAGTDGENLSWRTSMATPAPVRPALEAAPAPREPAPRGPRLRGLVRRMALWGAGDNGVNLAWCAHPVPAPARRLDPPVVLREMPSTPLIQPAATSPAAALVPAVPAPAGRRPIGRRPIGPVLPRVAPVEPVGWCAPVDPSSPAVSGWPAPPTGWPQPPEWSPGEPAVPVSTPSPVSTSSGRAAHSRPAIPVARFPFPSPRERGLARARGDPLFPPARGSPALRPAHAAPG